MKSQDASTLAAPARSRSFVPSRVVLLDIAERTIILAVYSQFLLGLLSLSAKSLQIGGILQILSEGIPIFFLLIRRVSDNISRNPFDWGVAVTGSCMPLLVNLQVTAQSLAAPNLCAIIILIGLCVQIAAKIVLGNKFGSVAANRGVEVSGPYRFVRHPMYLGYTLSHVGFLMLKPSVLNATLYVFTFVLQVTRILREERLLNADPAYRAFAARVRYRLVPGVF